MTPTGTPTMTPTGTPTTTPTPVSCPATGDLADLPAGDTIEWTPVTVDDPTSQPGNPGDVVYVYANNVIGYTWHVLRTATGQVSADCGGQPLDAGLCFPAPDVAVTVYGWNEDTAQWDTWGSYTLNGCGGGGGNN